jgi:uncharacterized protein involved in exopolysaccharide biosynthesis
MQDYRNPTPDDEIDLRELFILLWAHKILIASTCVFGIVCGVFYFQNVDKKFTSAAIFKLDNIDSIGFSFAEKEMGSLASLAGLGGMSDSSSLPMDQVSGRIFIQQLDTELNFQADPYFNTYNPDYVDPIWKSIIKRAIGMQKTSTDVKEIAWQAIVRRYSKNVILAETKEESAQVLVTHVNPNRAAEIANGVMNRIISNAKNKQISKQEQRLSYLSSTLAKALGDLEVAQNNLKEFTLKNSALPLESFAAGSMALDTLREQLARTTKLHEAVAELSLMLQNKNIRYDDYLKLRQKFPIVDQVEFRRVLGQNEIISSWSWPEANSVDAVFETLSDRINRLQSDIDTLQKSAELSGQALETFAKLEREAKIAEATYTVLIEQVKAQSVAAGYQPNNTEVYEYASASTRPSTPKINQVLPMGAILGLIVGVILSFVMARIQDVYYSRKSLKAGAKARFTFNIRTLKNLRNKSLTNLNTMIVKKPYHILRDMAVEIHKSGTTQVVVTSSRSKLSADDTARALASFMQSDTMKVAVLNFSSRAKKLDVDYERLSIGSFVVTEHDGHVSILSPEDDLKTVELLSKKDFRESIDSLKSTFDLVFLSADNGVAISLLRALDEQKAFHITLARIRKTKSASLTQMRSRLQIQGLLHD